MTKEKNVLAAALALVGRRFLIGAAVIWAVMLAALHGPGPGAVLEEGVALPLAFAAREAFASTPPMDERLRIFSLDDSALALERRGHLSGAGWAHVLQALAAAHPAAIVTTYGFDAGELDEDGGVLVDILAKLEAQGTRVTAATFAYPTRINRRDPIPLDRPQFRAPPPVLPTALDGWLLYGATPTDAARFGALGHVLYDGHGRASPFLRLAPGRVVPHIGLAAVDGLRLAAAPPPPVNALGKVLVDLAPRSVYADHTKSLRVLLEDSAETYARTHVVAGDVVLVLMDMYTGRASFVATPEGQLPGGYIVAAMLNSALRGVWLGERDFTGALTVLAALVGSLLGLLLAGRPLGLALVVMSAVVVLGGLLGFVYCGVAWPWIPALVALDGLALTMALRRQARRLGAARRQADQTERETAKLNAVVRTAQMFAHDVRKPFSMLNVAMQSLQRQSDPAVAARVLTSLMPELTRAMLTVEGMLQDVIEIDATAKLNIDAVHLADVTAEALRDVFLVRDNASVSIAYDLGHTLPVAIDRTRMRRVLGNLFDNAVQAMDGYGRLWIVTRDVVQDGQGFIEVLIGNSGSYLPPEELARVFEAFYTRGKKEGTGLGLAIAQKVVMQHGGRIWCTSERGKGTEFFLTLPVARVTPESTVPRLPATADEFRRGSGPTAPAPALRAHDKALKARLEEQLAAFRARRGHRFRILMVDDEVVYLESLMHLFATAASPALLELATARDAREAEAACARSAPDVLVADVDLGPGSTSGFELIEGLRGSGYAGFVMIHSNRVMPQDQNRAQAVKADVFLPKPARFTELVEQVSRALLRAADADGVPPEAPWIALVDDSQAARAAWTAALLDARVIAFASPTEFWARVGAEPALLARLAGIITDDYFAQDGEDSGAAFAKAVKSQRADLLVIMTVAPSANSGARAVGAMADAIVPKDPQPWVALKARLSKAS